MTTPPSPYAKGYYEGYLQRIVEQGGGKGRYESEMVAAKVANDAVSGMSAEAEGDYWLGYYHGAYHARTGNPPPAAANPLPAQPVESSAYLRDKDDLRAARQQLGLSQEALARALGTTVTTVARWERGQRWPRDIGIIALALERLGWHPVGD